MWLLVDNCVDDKLIKILGLLKVFIQMVEIFIPIALVVLGTIDLGRSVISLDEDGIKKGQMKLVRRIFAAVLVFLVAVIVNYVMTFFGNKTWKDCWNSAVIVKSAFIISQ